MNSPTAARESTHSLCSNLHHDVRLPSALPPSNVGDTLSLFVTTTLEQTLSSVIEKKIVEGLSRFEAAHPMQQEVLDQHYWLHETRKSNTNVATFAETRIDPRVHGQKASTAKRRRRIFWKNFRTPLGYISLRCDVAYQKWTAKALYDEDRIFEFRFAFIPQSWLFRRASFVTGTCDPFPNCSLTALNFHFRPVIDSNSAIFRACKAGDIDTMRFLLQNKQASPHVINFEGEDLLLVRTQSQQITTYAYNFARLLQKRRTLPAMKLSNSS